MLLAKRTGPPADLELTLAAQDIPALTITRTFETGPVLVFALGEVFNGTAGLYTGSLRLFIDDVQQFGTNQVNVDIAAGERGAIPLLYIAEVDQGRHTLKLQLNGVAAVGDVLRQDRAHFIVFQPPLSATFDDIT